MKGSSERHGLPGSTQLVDFSTYVTALVFIFVFRAAGFQFVGHLVVTLAISEAKITPQQCRTSSSRTRQVYVLPRSHLAYTSIIKPFDVAFHPKEPVVFSSLLTGQVCAWSYDDATGETSSSWSVRPSKRTARALSIEESGDEIWMGGKSGSLLCAQPFKRLAVYLLISNCSQLSTRDGSMTRERDSAHE